MRRVLEEIRSYANIPIIVEGKKDKSALGKLGFKNIIEISGRTLYEVADQLDESSTAIIMTDFDEEGREIDSRLSKLLTSKNIKVHHHLRYRLQNLFKFHQVEEINSIAKLLEDDYYGKTSSIYDKIFNRNRVLLRRNGGKARHHRGDIRPDRRFARSRS